MIKTILAFGLIMQSIATPVSANGLQPVTYKTTLMPVKHAYNNPNRLNMIQSNPETELLNPQDVRDPIQISKTSYEMDEFSNIPLEIKLVDVSDNAKISFKIEKPEIVEIDENNIMYARKVGSSIVTIRVTDGEDVFEKEIAVRVLTLKGSIEFKEKEISLERGTNTKLEYTLSSKNLESQRIAWNSENPGIAEVVDGKVTAKQAGTTKITAKIGDITSSVTVTVYVSLQQIEFNPSEITVLLDDPVNLPDLIYVPYDTTIRRYATYEVDDESVITLEDGMIVSHKVGKAMITATVNNKTTSLSVEVKPKRTESGADILKPQIEKQEGNRIIYVMDDLKDHDNTRFSITMPVDSLSEFIASTNDPEVIIVLNDALLRDGMSALERFELPRKIMETLDRPLRVHLVDERNVPLIIYEFKNAYTYPVDLRFSVKPLERKSPYYELINGRAYNLVFANATGFATGTAIELSARLIESSFSQMHFIYERRDNSLQFTNQEVTVSNEDRIRFNVVNNNYIITYNKIAKSDNSKVIIGLLVAVLTVIGGMSVFYYNKYKKKKKI